MRREAQKETCDMQLWDIEVAVSHKAIGVGILSSTAVMTRAGART